MAYYVYMLLCKDETIYTGYTTNIQQRVRKHNEGKGAKYTRGRGPVQLIYIEEHLTKGEAMRREAEIKKLDRNQKLKLVERNENDGMVSKKLSTK